MNRLLCAVLLSAAIAPIHSSEAGYFVPTGAMGVVRYGHTATLLNDGRVLVVGGVERAAQHSAELFDPGSGQSSTLPPLQDVHSGHSATLLKDGRVLITGGNADAGMTSRATVFDPVTESFTRVGDLTSAQTGHSATLMADGRVLIAGGLRYDERQEVAVAKAEVFDPATGRFSTVADYAVVNSLYPPARGPVWPSAIALTDGRVLLTGNLVAELFDPVSNRFEAGAILSDPELPFGRYWHSSTLLDDGSVLIVGGAEVETTGARSPHAHRFDPASATFTLVATMQEGRGLHSATKLRDGSVLVVGGQIWIREGREGHYGGSLATSERYDPTSRSFRPDARMSTARSGHTATLLKDGRVLILGGIGLAPYGSGSRPQLLATAEFYVDTPAACGKAIRNSHCFTKGD